MPQAQIIDGKKLAAQIKAEIKQKIETANYKPVFAVICVGNDEASKIYIRQKTKAAAEAGIVCMVYKLPESTSQKELLDKIDNLNNNHDINGIIVQLPLPQHLDAEEVMASILPNKDVDGFNYFNVGLLHATNRAILVPATPAGVVYMLKSVLHNLEGLHAVIIGRSNIVGKPLSALLLKENCTVTVAHSKSKNLQSIAQTADILVVATGEPHLVNSSWIKFGATVIDVGISRQYGKLMGDVDFDSAQNVAAYISPVPGGVGPLTIAMLLQNVLKAYLLQQEI